MPWPPSKGGDGRSSPRAGPPGRAESSAAAEEERRQILEPAINAGRRVRRRRSGGRTSRPTSCALRRGRGVVVSSHYFGAVPQDLPQRAAAMRSAGAEVVKIAIEARALGRRAAAAWRWLTRHDAATSPTRAHRHGRRRPASRVLAARLGNRWTYAGDGVAPGQLSAARLLARVQFQAHPTRYRRSTASSATPSGTRIRRSCTTPGFAALGLDAVYVPLEAARRRRFRPLRAGRDPQRRQHHRAVQGGPDVTRRRGRSAGASASAPSTRSSCATDGGLAGTQMSTVPRAVDGPHSRCEGRAPSILGAGGAARGVAIALADRRRRHRLRARVRKPPARSPTSSAATSARPAAGRQLGRPHQRHVRGTRPEATEPDRRCAARRAKWSSTWSTSRPKRSCSPTPARRLHDDRRARNARRAGRAAIRNVDRAQTACRALRDAAAGTRRSGQPAQLES